MCINTKNQKTKSKSNIPKAFINAKNNKIPNKTQAFINAYPYKTKKWKERRKQHLQHMSKTINKQITQAHKAFINAHKIKQQKHQQNTPNQSKTTNKKQPKTTTQITHPKTYKIKTENHNITKPTSHTKIRETKTTKYQNIHHKKTNLNLHKTKQTRPNGLARKQNSHTHYIGTNPKQQNTKLYKTTPKQKITHNKNYNRTHTSYTTYSITSHKETKPTNNYKKINTSSSYNQYQTTKHKTHKELKTKNKTQTATCPKKPTNKQTLTKYIQLTTKHHITYQKKANTISINRARPAGRANKQNKNEKLLKTQYTNETIYIQRNYKSHKHTKTNISKTSKKIKKKNNQLTL